ncbi:uncharacterized protein B0H18DRAFT_450396 [Fomitopsis serialis]|uniref:uncharacterized protein n=1 Tax=Fomitopsis serialis TaxID=139415 RepID=UPI0020085F11|nr:uncharacterized protein B0H18DRAFT_450396 [Neoantrodia serialis]KAH9923858.1 hypothetical protein B0H18DRAFT_450396 [Neoantrodia serialis]
MLAYVGAAVHNIQLSILGSDYPSRHRLRSVFGMSDASGVCSPTHPGQDPPATSCLATSMTTRSALRTLAARAEGFEQSPLVGSAPPPTWQYCHMAVSSKMIGLAFKRRTQVESCCSHRNGIITGSVEGELDYGGRLRSNDPHPPSDLGQETRSSSPSTFLLTGRPSDTKAATFRLCARLQLGVYSMMSLGKHLEYFDTTMEFNSHQPQKWTSTKSTTQPNTGEPSRAYSRYVLAKD